MTKIFSAVLLLIFCASLGAVDMAELADIKTEEISSNLKLNEKQTEQVRAIITSHLKAWDSKMQEYKSDPRHLMDLMRNLQSETYAQVKNILDDSQKEMLSLYSKPILPDQNVIFLNQSLDLSADQISQIEEIYASYRPQDKGPEKGGGFPDPEQMEKRRKQRQQMLDDIRDLLSDEQKVEFDEWQAEQEKQRPENMPPRGGVGGF